MCECTCKKATLIFLSIWSLIALFTAILVAVSFSTLENNKAGVKFDTINYLLENNVIYLSGRHWVGLGNEFKVFPLDSQRIDFTSDQFGLVLTKSSDPLQMYLEVSITYKLRQEFLIQLYNRFPNMDYHFIFADIAKEAIINTAQKFSLNDFFSKRGAISDEMSNSVNIEFRSVFSELELFELREIVLDESLEKRIVHQMTTLNEGLVQKATAGIKQTEGYIEIVTSSAEANVGSIISNAERNSKTLVSKDESEAFGQMIDSHADAFKSFVDAYSVLKLSQKELIKLMYYVKLDEDTFYEEGEGNLILQFGINNLNYIK